MAEGTESGSAARRGLNPNYINQLRILQVMSRSSSTTPRQFQIKEVAEMSGLRDEKEVQRYLYILEGYKYVTPLPPGDFTSKVWQITTDGTDALKSVAQSAAENN